MTVTMMTTATPSKSTQRNFRSAAALAIPTHQAPTHPPAMRRIKAATSHPPVMRRIKAAIRRHVFL